MQTKSTEYSNDYGLVAVSKEPTKETAILGVAYSAEVSSILDNFSEISKAKIYKHVSEKLYKKLGFKTSTELLKEIAACSVLPLSKQPSNHIFNTAFNVLQVEVGALLFQKKIKRKLRITIHTPLAEYETVFSRLKILEKIAKVGFYIEAAMGCSEKLWACTLRETQSDNSEKVAINQIKRFPGRLFPESYVFQETSHPRYNAYPSGTARCGFKAHRFKLFQAISHVTGWKIYDMDFSACHLRVMACVISPGQGPLLHQVVTSSDAWLGFVQELVSKNPSLYHFPIKTLRKVIKIKCLSIINGNGMGNTQAIKINIAEGNDAKGKPLATYESLLETVISTLTVIKEFYINCKYINAQGFVYLVHENTKTLPDKNKKGTKGAHSLNSKVYAATESLCMSFLIEFISGYNLKMLPLVCEHDGIVIACQEELSANQIKEIYRDFEVYLSKRLYINFPIELELMV